MSSDPRPDRPSSKRKYILLMAAVLAVTGGWSGAWLFGRSILSEQLNAQLSLLSEHGTDAECAELLIGGFPFRYEVRCSGFGARNLQGIESTLSSLNAVALVYNPWHVILEAETPAAIKVPSAGLSGQLTWETARASAKYSAEQLGDVAVVLTRPGLTVYSALGSGQAASEKAELHLRPSPDASGTIEGFLSINGLTLDQMPALPSPANARVHARISNGAALLMGSNLPETVRHNGGELPISLELAEVELGASRFGGHGDLVLNGAGTLSGNLTLTLAKPEGFLATVRPLFPPNSNEFSILQSLLTSLQPTGTNHAGEPAVEFPLSVDNGVMRIGFVTLGRIPPLFQAGS